MNPPETLHVPRAEEEGISSPTATVILTLITGILVPALIAYWMATDSEVRVIAVVLAVLGFLVLMARPFWGLMFLVGLIYLRPEDTFTPLQGMRLTLWVSLGTILATFVHMVLKREPIVRTPLNGMLFGFMACVVISTYRVGISEDAAEDVTRLLIITFLIINLIREPARFSIFVNAMLGFTIYLAGYAIYLYFTGRALDHHGVLRAQGTGIFADPNDLAASIVAGLALALARFATSVGPIRAGYLGLSAFFVSGVLFTNSRGGMVALMVVAVGFLLVFVRMKTFALGMSAIAVLALLTFGPSRMTNFDRTDQSASNRFSYWETGWYMLQSDPVLGIGYGRFPEENGGATAHNSFVLCFAELGLTGYFFWMGIFYFCFKNMEGEGKVRLIEKADVLPMGPKVPNGELLGARLALVGYLAAAFWISRTYVPVMFVMIGLPIAAQVAASGNITVHRESKEKFRDFGRIIGIAVLSIVFIRVVTIVLQN